MPRIAEIIKRQWRGEYPIAVSFLAIGVIEKLLEIALRPIGNSVISIADTAETTFVALAAFYISTEAVCVWWWVGAWRSATKNSPTLKFKSWAVIVKLAICLLVIADIANYTTVWPMFSDALSDLKEDPQWGPRGVITTSNKQELKIHGYLTRSVVIDFQRALSVHSKTVVIGLDSLGGRVGPALAISDIVRTRKLDTLVEGTCASACVIAFLGGKHRWITANARLGFHSAAFGGVAAQAANEQYRLAGIKAGVSEQFLDTALSSPTVWYPSSHELKMAGVITGVIDADGDQ
ncbi:MAG: ATP-dependent Clp protease proteolytic subunit [Rhizomicrobium sp.]